MAHDDKTLPYAILTLYIAHKNSSKHKNICIYVLVIAIMKSDISKSGKIKLIKLMIIFRKLRIFNMQESHLWILLMEIAEMENYQAGHLYLFLN